MRCWSPAAVRPVVTGFSTCEAYFWGRLPANKRLATHMDWPLLDGQLATPSGECRDYYMCGVNGCILAEGHRGICAIPTLGKRDRKACAPAPPPAAAAAAAAAAKCDDAPVRKLKPPASDISVSVVTDDPARVNARPRQIPSRLGQNDGWCSSPARAWVSSGEGSSPSAPVPPTISVHAPAYVSADSPVRPLKKDKRMRLTEHERQEPAVRLTEEERKEPAEPSAAASIRRTARASAGGGVVRLGLDDDWCNSPAREWVSSEPTWPVLASGAVSEPAHGLAVSVRLKLRGISKPEGSKLNRASKARSAAPKSRPAPKPAAPKPSAPKPHAPPARRPTQSHQPAGQREDAVALALHELPPSTIPAPVKPHPSAAQAAAPLMMKKRASLAYQSECAQVAGSAASAASAAVPESVERVSVQDAAAGLLFLVTSSEPQPSTESQPAAERMASETYSLAVSPVGSADGPWGGSSVQWTRPCSPAASPALLPVAATAASATHIEPACAESGPLSRMPSPREIEEVPHSHLSLVGRNVMMPIPSEWAPAPRVALMPVPAAPLTLASLGVASVGASAPIELTLKKEDTVSTAASAVAEAALAIAAATRATSTSSAKPTARRGRPPSQAAAAAAAATSWDPRWVSVPFAGASTIAAPTLATSTLTAAPAAPSCPEQQLVLANAHEALAKAAHAAQAAHTQAYAQAAYAQAMAQAAQAQAHARAQASLHAQAQPPAPPPASSDQPGPSAAPVQVQVQAQAQVQQVPIPAAAPTHAPAPMATHAPAHMAQA